jgi:hypothetical protein
MRMPLRLIACAANSSLSPLTSNDRLPGLDSKPTIICATFAAHAAPGSTIDTRSPNAARNHAKRCGKCVQPRMTVSQPDLIRGPHTDATASRARMLAQPPDSTMGTSEGAATDVTRASARNLRISRSNTPLLTDEQPLHDRAAELRDVAHFPAAVRHVCGIGEIDDIGVGGERTQCGEHGEAAKS